MPEAARKTDQTEHGGTLVEGCASVTINGIPAARLKHNHSCPSESGGSAHVGGPIVEGSTTVTMEGLLASRKGDHLMCCGPARAEVKKINNLKELVPKKEISRSGSLADAKGRVESEYGTVEGQVKVGTYDAQAKVEVGVDLQNPSVSLETSGKVGVALLEGKLTGETAQIRIPWTDWGISFGGEATGSIATLKAEGNAKFELSKKGLDVSLGAKIGAALFGGGLKGGIKIKPMKQKQDAVTGGSPDVLID